MTMKIPNKPRIERTIDVIKQFLMSDNINWLPVDPFKIAERHGWGPVSVGEIIKRQKNKTKRSEVIRGKEGATLYVNGKYRIIYNELVRSEGRKRWTIMHEIGHIVLNHLHDYPEIKFFRGGLEDDKYNVLEREADDFVSEVLAPMVVLMECNIATEFDIIKYCQLSGEAAKIRGRDLLYKWDKLRYYRSTLFFYHSHYAEFLKNISICSNNYYDHDKKFIRAHEKAVTELSEFQSTTGKELYAKVDQEGKFWQCPKCRNTDFSPHALHCKMCGTYLFNDCQNQPDNYENDFCGKRNPGDARHCEYCGEETYLLKKGLIMSWEEVVAELGEISKGVSSGGQFDKIEEKFPSKMELDPFSDEGKPIEISDDDLPFR